MIEAGDQARTFGASVLTPAADRYPLGRLSLAPWDLVRMALATVLLTAAALKAHQLATEPVAETSLLTSRWFLIALVEFELAIGLWLLAGLYSRMTWAVAVTCFSAFGAVALYRAVIGEDSCGCFGRVELSPWWALGLDAAAVTALLIWRPRVSQLDQDSSAAAGRARRPLVVVLSTGLLLGVPAGVTMASYSPGILAADGVIVGDDDFVILEPEKWVGKRFPLLDYIDIGDQLAKGGWVVLLYHHDCPKCREALAYFAQLAREGNQSRPSGGMALISVPPHGADPIAFPSAAWLQGRMSPEYEWFVQTPCELALDNGVVTYAGVRDDWNDPSARAPRFGKNSTSAPPSYGACAPPPIEIDYHACNWLADRGSAQTRNCRTPRRGILSQQRRDPDARSCALNDLAPPISTSISVRIDVDVRTDQRRRRLLMRFPRPTASSCLSIGAISAALLLDRVG